MHRSKLLISIIFISAPIFIVHTVPIDYHPESEIDDEFYNQLLQLFKERQEGNNPCRDYGTGLPTLISDWPNKTQILGDVGGLDTDADGNVVVFHRGSRIWDGSAFASNFRYQSIDDGPISVETVLVLDHKTGEIVAEYGKNKFYMPHGLTVDDKGNFWMTDVALHQVLKFPPDFSQPLLVLGEEFIPGNDANHFCMPTDVAVSTSGQFFVSDGYCNSRIIKYSPTGLEIIEWGSENGKPMFAIVHSIVLDEKNDIICAADREQSRVLCFGAGMHDPRTAGNLLITIPAADAGRVYAIALGLGNELYGVATKLVGNSLGFSVNLERQDQLATWGPSENFTIAHDIAVSPDGNSLYVGKIHPNPGIVKFAIC